MLEDTKIFIREWDEEKKLPGPRTKKYRHIFEDIQKHTKHYPESYTMSQRMWVLKYGDPKCPVCDCPSKLTKNIPIKPRHCSIQCVGKNPTRMKKIQSTMQEKYGAKHPMHVQKFRDAVSDSLSGRERDFIPHYTDDLRKETYYSKEWLEKMYLTEKKSIEYICSVCEVTNAALYRQFKRFGIELKRSKRSYFEEQIVDFIQQHTNKTIKLNYKDLKDVFEVDVFMPEYNLAIECDGLYWHSYPIKPKEYHQKKKLSCLSQKVNLLSIFEHEYINSREIVESTILSHLGIYNKKIRASKCDIRKVSTEQERKFLNENHIQGYHPSRMAMGLFEDNKLVYLMSFGVPRFDKNYEWEIIRCCGKMNHKVYGGASRLWKNFVENINPRSVISYCNLRYGSGGMYETLGFEREKTTKPSYFYFNPAKLKISSKRDSIEIIPRYRTQKKYLHKLLENFDPEKTEFENMTSNGYLQVFDSGHFRYIWNAK
jgi:hypothetical protein